MFDVQPALFCHYFMFDSLCMHIFYCLILVLATCLDLLLSCSRLSHIADVSANEIDWVFWMPSYWLDFLLRSWHALFVNQAGSKSVNRKLFLASEHSHCRGARSRIDKKCKQKRNRKRDQNDISAAISDLLGVLVLFYA